MRPLGQWWVFSSTFISRSAPKPSGKGLLARSQEGSLRRVYREELFRGQSQPAWNEGSLGQKGPSREDFFVLNPSRLPNESELFVEGQNGEILCVVPGFDEGVAALLGVFNDVKL